MKGTGPAPFQGVQTLTQACGGPSGGATGAFDDPNTDQPFRAPTWADCRRGEVRLTGAAAKVDRAVGQRPGRPGLRPDRRRRRVRDRARRRPGGHRHATASTAAPAGGFTLMGSPTIVADINSPGPTSQLAARLLDVDPERQRDARRPRPLPARDQLRHDGDAPGLPAPPERLEVRRPATSPSSSCCRRTSPTAATRTGRRTVTVSNLRAAPAGARDSRRARRPRAESRGEGRPDRLPAVAGLRRDRIRAAEGATPFRVSLVPAFAPCTGRQPPARPAAGIPRPATRRSKPPASSRSARRIPTSPAANSVGLSARRVSAIRRRRRTRRRGDGDVA